MTPSAATGKPTRVLEPRGLDQLGRGVALDQGRPVLIPGALPGDSVRCRTVARRRNHDEAVIGPGLFIPVNAGATNVENLQVLSDPDAVQLFVGWV